jgi:hypothetical protein
MGFNYENGQLGDGTLKNKQLPIFINLLPPNITQIIASDYHSVALSIFFFFFYYLKSNKWRLFIHLVKKNYFF